MNPVIPIPCQEACITHLHEVSEMAYFFQAIGFTTCCLLIIGAIFGVVFGLSWLIDTIKDYKKRIERLEEKIK